MHFIFIRKPPCPHTKYAKIKCTRNILDLQNGIFYLRLPHKCVLVRICLFCEYARVALGWYILALSTRSSIKSHLMISTTQLIVCVCLGELKNCKTHTFLHLHTLLSLTAYLFHADSVSHIHSHTCLLFCSLVSSRPRRISRQIVEWQPWKRWCDAHRESSYWRAFLFLFFSWSWTATRTKQTWQLWQVVCQLKFRGKLSWRLSGKAGLLCDRS